MSTSNTSVDTQPQQQQQQTLQHLRVLGDFPRGSSTTNRSAP
eukprot:CAMPEP_0115730622 /NCGR_PEP_ID=MMETSP0272-20121206/84136_1 /TAXON_ID=71861 /ORGANISM="Scrippsiella trochoidea, Strain CCMP3099" /LENGTH=41 /DNA_ID= /DNA_START= /DNA_END= /DNA_ORIENTATION=